MAELDNIVDLSSVQFTATPGTMDLATSDTYGVVAQKAKAINAKMLNTEDLSSTSSFDVKDLKLYGGSQDFRIGSIADRNAPQFSPTSSFGVSEVDKKQDAAQASSTSFELSDFKITPQKNDTMKLNSDIFSSTSSFDVSGKLSEIEYGSQGGGAKARKVVKRGGKDEDSDSDSSSSSSSSSSSQDGGNEVSTSFTFGSSFLKTSSKRGGRTSKNFITGSRRLPGATATPRIDDEPAYLLSDSAAASSHRSFGSDWGVDNESSDFSTLLKA